MSRDPGQVNEEFRPHDLLWLTQYVAKSLQESADELPAWVRLQLQSGHPVVVRRAQAVPGQVAIGVRGPHRGARFAGFVVRDEVVRCVKPVALRSSSPHPTRTTLPAWQAWMALHDSIDIPYAWGPTGSCGYELATGIATVEPTSDLDLVVYADEPISREAARELSRMFTHPACRCDVQLDTPAGGIALREWARGDTRVLVKTPYGPVLSNQPWRVMSGA